MSHVEPPPSPGAKRRRYVIDAELAEGIRQFSDLVSKKARTIVPEALEQKDDNDLIPPEWKANIKEILFPAEVIQARVGEMASEISSYYRKTVGIDANNKVLVVGLLTGSIMFATDLLRKFTVPHELDFMAVSSYGAGTKSSGSIKLKKDLSIDPAGRHVLIVEDLIDTGKTLAWIREHLSSKRCASVQLACFLDKPARREADVQVDFTGFSCPDYFVVGYGMDFADDYRCMPFVGVLKPEAYAKPQA